jgi:hypothetical protein
MTARNNVPLLFRGEVRRGGRNYMPCYYGGPLSLRRLTAPPSALKGRGQ